MPLRDEDFEVLSGQTVRYDRKANSGNVIAMLAPEHPGAARHQGGARGHARHHGLANIWTDSKAAWVKIDPELVNFPKGAVDRTPLFDAWTRRNQQMTALIRWT